MAIALTPGQLYFIRDVDYLTGEVGRYIKIGIVTNNRTTEQRMKDHQTGNPRGIIEVHEVKDVPFVERLETQLHYENIEKWIAGEWFLLDDAEVQLVVKRATDLKIEQQDNEATIKDVLTRLNQQVSNEIIVPRTTKAEAIEKRLLDVKSRMNILNALIEISKFEFYTVLGTNGSIDKVLKIRYTPASFSFDEASFKNDHPSLYSSYLVSQPDKLNYKFTLKNVKSVSLEKTDAALHDQFKALGTTTFQKSQLNNILPRTKTIEEMHIKHLFLVKEQKLLEFEYELLECKLKQLVDINLGIEEICTWSRVLTSSKDTFNSKKLKEDDPSLYDKYCTKLKAEIFSMEIEKFRSYKPIP
ncbi:MAG: GIY-YIG nuclease family protein [Bacteroidota bacterium]